MSSQTTIMRALWNTSFVVCAVSSWDNDPVVVCECQAPLRGSFHTWHVLACMELSSVLELLKNVTFILHIHNMLLLAWCVCLVMMQEISETEAVAIVHLAYQFGINFFDTSPFYGNTRSEEVRLDAIYFCALPHMLLILLTSMTIYSIFSFHLLVFQLKPIRRKFPLLISMYILYDYVSTISV